jgi:hypothetical protein
MRPARAAADMAIRAQRVCDWSVVVGRKDAGEIRAIRRAWTRLVRDVMTAKSQRYVTVTLAPVAWSSWPPLPAPRLPSSPPTGTLQSVSDGGATPTADVSAKSRKSDRPHHNAQVCAAGCSRCCTDCSAPPSSC